RRARMAWFVTFRLRMRARCSPAAGRCCTHVARIAAASRRAWGLLRSRGIAPPIPPRLIDRRPEVATYVVSPDPSGPTSARPRRLTCARSGDTALAMDAERIARNDATFRQANEEIERAAEPLGIEPIPFLCECADERCTEIVK